MGVIKAIYVQNSGNIWGEKAMYPGFEAGDRLHGRNTIRFEVPGRGWKDIDYHLGYIEKIEIQKEYCTPCCDHWVRRE